MGDEVKANEKETARGTVEEDAVVNQAKRWGGPEKKGAPLNTITVWLCSRHLRLGNIQLA